MKTFLVEFWRFRICLAFHFLAFLIRMPALCCHHEPFHTEGNAGYIQQEWALLPKEFGWLAEPSTQGNKGAL